MTGEWTFIPFRDTGGNKSYVRASWIAAIYHDGKETNIVISGKDGGDLLLKSIDMPEAIYEKIRALQVSQQGARR